MKHVLLTGAAGFIGSHLTEALLARGYAVTGLDNFLTGRKSNLETALRHPNFNFVERDVCTPLTDADLPFIARHGLHGVFHFACPASPVDFDKIPYEILAVDSIGTMNTVELARAHGARYLVAGEKERHAILHEIIRLEPVVGHIYRRAQDDIEISDGDDSWTIGKGELIDLYIRHANADPRAVGDEPLNLCPGRELPRGVNETVMSFGDGAHKCPGQHLAISESDALLRRLLARDVTIVHEPTMGWDELISGYMLRGFALRIGSGQWQRVDDGDAT